MSAFSTPSDSPLGTPIQPLHNPALAAQVVVPQAPLGDVVNKPGMGAKALLANKMAKNRNPAFVSPTDNLMTPCTQKLNAARKKQFSKASKPVQLFAKPENTIASEEEPDSEAEVSSTMTKMGVDEENPF